jgi:hypothetical protein
VQEAGVRCTRCRSGRCARPSGWRCRKRVTDLSTGDVFEHIGIRQVIFCDGKTASLVPAELWRGLFTVTSVMETGIYILRDGLPAAYDWCWEAGRDGSPVSLPTLWRWRDIVGQRLMGSALRWLGPELRFSWADQRSEAAKLEALLKRLTPGALLGFRAQFGRACLDRARSERRSGRRKEFSAPRIAERDAAASPRRTVRRR